ncbi:MAG: hypothetical protein CVV24_11645 [Ignavibacteriae bacterium HGW-Ignavibacteriae-3]|nr:MAG: hypothetical protein CVV24_11645 [Ignavibacteriae bacterium HGW-Ignavibacteriae-3]
MESTDINGKDDFAVNSERKLSEALKLYFLARELKAIGLKMVNPHLTEQQVKEKVKEIFLNARS